MTVNINGCRIPYEPDLVWDCLRNISKAIRPCNIYDYLSIVHDIMMLDRDIYNMTDLSEINTELSELTAVEVWL